MKKLLCVVPLVLVFCFTIACQDRATMAELTKFKAQAKIEEQNEATARAVFDGLNRQKESVYQDLYAPEYGWRFPSNNPKAMTREEEAAFVKLIWAGFPDIHWNVEEMIARGDMVIARYIARGTHKGQFQGLLPTGNTVEASGIWMARIKNGKITDAKEDSDMLGMMQQLGMELKPTAAKRK